MNFPNPKWRIALLVVGAGAAAMLGATLLFFVLIPLYARFILLAANQPH